MSVKQTRASLVLSLCCFSAARCAGLPKIDFDALGHTAIVGNFAGLQLYDPSYQSALVSAGISADKASLWSRSARGDLLPLGSTDAGGSINVLCQSKSGLLYFGGNFTSIASTTTRNIASYNPSTNAFASLDQGLDGTILSLACDDQDNLLYVGGSFKRPVGSQDASFGGSVAAWSFSSSTWTSLAFGGLDGDVLTIESAGSGDTHSVFFGGNFSIQVANSSTDNDVSTSAFPSLGSSLAPISLNTSYLWAGPTGSGDPASTFCPVGDGLTGSNWMTPENTAAIFVVRLYEPLQARGIRLGNAFTNGRGTKQFKLITVPDSIVQPLTYYSNPSDPTSAQAGCQWECPLSDNSSVPYQDFLFDQELNITGFQVDVDAWYGSAGGLHQVSLLSTGSFAYAVNALNGNATTTCDSGIAAALPASVSVHGNWKEATIPSNIENVDTQVLVADVSSADQSASLTFSPAIVAKGAYDAYLLTPGCSAMGDCSSRTSVDLTITPGMGSNPPSAKTVDQTNTQDESVLVYSGELTAGATFALALSRSITLQGPRHLVAQKINLVAQSPNGTALASKKTGHGLFEYIPNGAFGLFGDGQPSTADLATNALTNASGFDRLSLAFTNASNAINSIVTINNAIYFGGNFTATGNVSTSNIAVYSGGQPKQSHIPAGGLNGPVTSLLVLNNAIYAAGVFTSTVDGTLTGLNGIARLSLSKNEWQALTNGPLPTFPNGATGLVAGQIGGDDAILVLGATGGIATYNSKTNSWDSSQGTFAVGSFSSAASSTGEDGTTFLAGRISAATKYRASSAATLTSNSSGLPSLTPLDVSVNNVSQSSQKNAARDMSHAQGLSALFARTAGLFAKRQATGAPVALPSAISLSDSPQILSGAFYNNQSNQLVIFGGHFSAGQANNVAVYDADADTLSPLSGQQTLEGTVLSVKVVKDILWLGGSFVVNTKQALATYDLSEDAWLDGPPPLTASNGQNAVVNVIAPLPNNGSSIIVAGTFSAAGALSCNGICLWDLGSSQWRAFGTGLTGPVAAVDFAGDHLQYLFAAGNFQVNNVAASVARWDFSKAIWTTLDGGVDLPGPATAIAADNGNENSVFLAGETTASKEPYLMHWNGTIWSDANSTSLSTGSIIQQLAFVPLSANHNGQGSMEADRMLMLSGALNLPDVGQISSVLYDGTSMIPFLSTIGSTGTAGTIAAFIYSVSAFRLAADHLSVGIVILISIAIALGIVFLLVLVGLLIALRHRDSSEGKIQPVQIGVPYTDQHEKVQHRPTSLLATLNAATAAVAAGDHSPRDRSAQNSPFPSEHSDDDAIAAGLGYPSGPSDYQDESNIVRTRYSFEAENHGELTVDANEEIRVLDRTDEQWWFAERADGSRGVVPASFLF